MDAHNHRRRQAAGNPVCSQASPGAVEAHGGTALEGRKFYVWDEDRQTAVAWANQLAAAVGISEQTNAFLEPNEISKPLTRTSDD